ncbi:MAG: hypothetical protein RIK87_08420 [Fuerstiella sp.]
MPKLVARFRFRTVRNNVRSASQFYHRRYRRMIMRQAAVVKTDAQQQMRWKRTGYPRPHTYAYLNNIRFGWDAGSRTAIVGPTRLKHFNVPRGLEFGGTTRWLHRVRGGWYRSGLQKVRRFGTMRRTVNRPYVQLQWRQIAQEELG